MKAAHRTQSGQYFTIRLLHDQDSESPSMKGGGNHEDPSLGQKIVTFNGCGMR